MNNPKHDDAVLGGNGKRSPLSTAAILGGIDGVKQRLKTGNPAEILTDAILIYGEAGKTLVRNYFEHLSHGEFFIDMVAAGWRLKIGKQDFWWFGPYVIYNFENELEEIQKATKVKTTQAFNRDRSVVWLWGTYPKTYSTNILASISNAVQDPNSLESYKINAHCVQLEWIDQQHSNISILLEQLEQFQLSRGISPSYSRNFSDRFSRNN